MLEKLEIQYLLLLLLLLFIYLTLAKRKDFRKQNQMKITIRTNSMLIKISKLKTNKINKILIKIKRKSLKILIF